jgi:hypothetical protein
VSGDLALVNRVPEAKTVKRRLHELVVDAVEPASIASWWGDLLGGTTVHDPRGYSFVTDIPGAPFEAWSFVPVPEPKQVKNRIHIDVFVDDVTAVITAGATVLRSKDHEIRWHVLADPEGNEFRVFDRS